MGQQACGFVLRLCGGGKGKNKEKEREKKFCYLCGCKLKACCFVLRLWGVCFTPVERRACSFVACMVTSLWFYHACMALCLCFIWKIRQQVLYCSICLCGDNLVCFFFSKNKTQTKKERKQGTKKQKKHVGKHVVFSGVFSRLLGDKLVFVQCLCEGKFVVSKFACGAIRLHTCSVHSNAPGKSWEQWSLDRLTSRCALCCYIYKSLCSFPSFSYEVITAVVVC